MIRSSAHRVFAPNKLKNDALITLVRDYRILVQAYIDHIWEKGIPEFDFDVKKNKLELKSFAPKALSESVQTDFSARAKQAASKQAIQMVKAATEKRRKQLYNLSRFMREGKNAKYLQSKIDRQPLVKPSASRIKVELDSRFVCLNSDASSLKFIKLTSLKKGLKLLIPYKETSRSKKWAKLGRLKSSIRLTEDTVWLIYEIKNAVKSGSEIVGADQGIITTLTLSNGVSTQKCNHGHDLNSILDTLSRKRRGSKAFKRAEAHRKNYINWSLNQINFKNIKELRLEKVKNLRKGRKSSRKLSHWCYTEIKSKLIMLGETEGFSIKEISNEFRSQRCNGCGWVRKANRKGKTFKCDKCEHAQDSDLNAAANLELDLFKIPYWVRKSKLNRKGFYWLESDLTYENGEPIVPQAQEE